MSDYRYDTKNVRKAAQELKNTGLFTDSQINEFTNWAEERFDGAVGISLRKGANVIGCAPQVLERYVKLEWVYAGNRYGWSRFLPHDQLIKAKQIYEKNMAKRRAARGES